MNHRQWKKNYKKKYGKNPQKEDVSETIKSLNKILNCLKEEYYKMMENPNTMKYMENIRKTYNESEEK